jgi:hypothetical protein
VRTRDSTTTNDDFAVSPDTILWGCCGLGHFNTDSAGFRTRFVEQDSFDYGSDSNCEVGTLEDTRWQVSNGKRIAWGSVSDVRDS